jgi:hypothetical protein
MKMENLRQRLFLVSAGGPLASLMVPVILENISFARPAWLANCVHFVALSSALLGISALLPDLNRSGKFSDGARLLMLLKNDARAERWLSILRIQCAWTDGKAPQTWPQSWVDSITSCDDSSRDAIHGHWLAYLWATDRQDVTRATLHLETALGYSAPVLRPLFQKILLEAAIFQAWFRENRAQADFWAGRLSRRKLSPWHFLPCEAGRVAGVTGARFRGIRRRRMEAPDGIPHAHARMAQYLQHVTAGGKRC